MKPYLLPFLILAVYHLPGPGDISKTLKGKKTAVKVYAQNPLASDFVRAAQSRIEAILMNNKVEVLDEEKARELSDVFTTLEDPAAFVTAETFIEHSEKFELEGLIAVYLSVAADDSLSGAHLATAHADIRFVDNTSAKVLAFSSDPLGVPGAPASEGLTLNSAAINAVRRSVENAGHRLGFDLAERTRPGSVDLTLSDPEPYTGSDPAFADPTNEEALWPYADLENKTWRNETVTTTARAPHGSIAAIAGYIRDTDFRRRPQRLYGSRVHMVDLRPDKKEHPFVILDASPVEMSASDEPRTKEIQFLAFAGGWRYLSALNGNHLFLWDTEQGRVLAKKTLTSEATGLAVVREAEGASLVINTREGLLRFRMLRSP